jgi:curved DNA-binding protein
MSHYDTLGIAKTATPEEIKKAYRKLASQHHPDKGGDTAKFQQIEEAYRILSDPVQREQYDNPQPHRFNFQNFGDSGFDNMPPGMEDIFRQFGFGFGGQPFGMHRGSQQQPRKNKDLRVNLPVDLSSTLQDQEYTISVQTTKNTRENVKITVPRGAYNGTQIKYPGLGDNFFDSLPRGDLFVNIFVKPHPPYVVHDLDVLIETPVCCLTAITGGEIEVEGIDGSKFVLVVPPGVQQHQILRIKEQGLWQIHGSTRGSLHVKIHLTVPRSLSEEQLKIIKDINSTL